MQRNLLLTAALGLCAAVFSSGACKPNADTFDAGCYPAAVSTPVDAGLGDAGCLAWTNGCSENGTTALLESIQDAFNSNGTCVADTDCGLYAPLGTQFAMQCVETYDVPTFTLSQRAALDQQLQSLICGFCLACGYDADGGGIVDLQPQPPADAGDCTEVSCVSGQCQAAQTFQL